MQKIFITYNFNFSLVENIDRQEQGVGKRFEKDFVREYGEYGFEERNEA